MKKVLTILLIICSLFLTGCAKSDAKKFKEEYESINNKENKNGKIHRIVTIDEKNPFVYSNASEIVQKIENKETFYVYFGDKLCPWCRSVIEKAIAVANERNIDKIYYVKIWDDDGNEVLRDKYVLENEVIKEEVKGSDDYFKLLDYFKEYLKDYTLTNEDGKKINIGEKRIYAPTFIYVKDGKLDKLEEGIPEGLDDPRGELTEDLLKKEEKLFKDLFKN